MKFSTVLKFDNFENARGSQNTLGSQKFWDLKNSWISKYFEIQGLGNVDNIDNVDNVDTVDNVDRVDKIDNVDNV